MDDNTTAPVLAFLDKNGAMRIRLGLDNYDTPELSLYNSPESISLWINTRLEPVNGDYRNGVKAGGGLQAQLEFRRDKQSQVNLFGQYSAGVGLTMNGEAPFISVLDKEGFEALLGSADLVTQRTGKTSRTSAASLVLFDKDKKVIWQAP